MTKADTTSQATPKKKSVSGRRIDGENGSRYALARYSITGRAIDH